MFCIFPMFMTSDNDFETALRLNRSKYSKNLIFSHLNINSSQGGYSRYFIAAETKTQFASLHRQNRGFIILCYVILTFMSVN